MTRELAQIPTPETVIPMLREAVAEGRMFEYRMTNKGRKHLAVDLFSAGMILRVYDAINETNKAKFAGIAPNVGRMALIALDVASKKGN